MPISYLCRLADRNLCALVTEITIAWPIVEGLVPVHETCNPENEQLDARR